MADEIRIIRTDRLTRRSGGAGVTALHLYLMNPVLETDGGQTIVPTPTSGLPPEIVVLNLLEANVVTAIDAGMVVFRVSTIRLLENEIGDVAAAAARLRADYASVDFVANLRTRFQFTGRKVNA